MLARYETDLEMHWLHSSAKDSQGVQNNNNYFLTQNCARNIEFQIIGAML